MLEIVKYNEDEYDFPCLLVLGCFDGLHIGHAELLKKAKLQAKINGLDLGVMLFADGKGGKNLYSFEERLEYLEKYNAKFVLKIDFTEEFKEIKPLDFLACLEDKLNVKAYMSGKDFRFGNGKKGKSSTLKTYAEDEENGVWYMPIKDVVVDGEKVGTSGIKTLLENGNVKKASELLGRNYAVTGTVIKGADRGKTLGFPTLNIEYPENKFQVKHGVYKVVCKVDENEYEGIANFGARPTFGEENVLLEAYLKNFEGSLYEKTVTIEFVDYIRDIRKFENSAELSAQLVRDLSGDTAESELAVADAAEPAVEAETTVETVEPAEETPAPEEAAPVAEEQVTEETAPIVEEQVTEEATPVEEEPITEEPVTEETVPVSEEPEETAEAEIEEVTEIIEEPVPEEVTETAEEIEQENDEFDKELEETVVIETAEIEELSEGRLTKEEKVFEKTYEEVTVEPVEEEVQPEVAEEPVEAEEIQLEEIVIESVESATEVTAEEILPAEFAQEDTEPEESEAEGD